MQSYKQLLWSRTHFKLTERSESKDEKTIKTKYHRMYGIYTDTTKKNGQAMDGKVILMTISQKQAKNHTPHRHTSMAIICKILFRFIHLAE